MVKIVLQKALAGSGVASRRAGANLITAGRVQVNGRVITKLGTRVNPDKDTIAVDGKVIKATPVKVYFLLHKPQGYISTVRDDRGRKTVLSLVKSPVQLVPVGRLDINTTGLTILTNDGDLVYELTHPKFEHEKEYEALVQVPQDWRELGVTAALAKLERGVNIAGNFRTSPAKVKLLKQQSNDRYLVSVTLHEGHKHQVRQMINAVGMSMVELKRVRMGPLKLGNLGLGQYRELTPAEIALLKRQPPSSR